MGLYAGIDLHSDNGYYGIVNEKGERVFQRRLPNDLLVVLDTLGAYRDDLKAVAVESTYNWYWLVDGLMDHGYPVRLANPGGMEQYGGLKDANDKTDAFFLAEMLRLGILPEGYIYPAEERPVRDLLRRRMLLVQQRTAQMMSFQSLMSRETGAGLGANSIRKLEEEDVSELLGEEHLVLMGQANIGVVRYLTERIRVLERAAVKRTRVKPEYEKLLSVPGIGTILGLTISLETGEIGRFAGVGNYTSYCRCVRAVRWSNEKAKGSNNRKNGNRYLGWAYVEAANFARRFCPEAKRFYQRKLSRTNSIVATKALASKVSKACYFIMRDQVEFDMKRIFG